jgi:ribonucleotide monophosphatase NagD (HAD superfamily)
VKEYGSSIKTIYMIGDNLRSDILGANTMNLNSHINWVSIAVKTGLFKHESDIDNHVFSISNNLGISKKALTPQVIVQDFQQAIAHIMWVHIMSG